MQLYDDWPDDLLRGVMHYGAEEQEPAQNGQKRSLREGISSSVEKGREPRRETNQSQAGVSKQFTRVHTMM